MVRSLQRLVLAAVWVGSMAGCVPQDPGPTHTVDQQNDLVSGSAALAVTPCGATTPQDSTSLAQTFTAGRTGALDQVSLVVWPGSSTSTLDVRIVTTASALPGWPAAPTATVLGEGHYSGAGSPNASTFIDIPLLDPADIVEGTRYAIVLSMPCGDPVNSWLIARSPIGGTIPYFGGDVFYSGFYASGNQTIPWREMGSNNDVDLVFTTWVI